MSVKSPFEGGASKKDLQKVEKGFWPKMKKFAGKVPFAVDAVALYYYVTDKKQPLLQRSAGIFALIYFIWPLDIIADVIPVAGLTDDAGVIAAVVGFYGVKLNPYREKAKKFFEK